MGRRAAIKASTKGLAESSGEEDIPVKPFEDPSYLPFKKDEQDENDVDDEMNDGPRQPASSLLPSNITSNQDREKEKARVALANDQRGAKKGKMKGEKDQQEADVDPKWLSCPVVECKGHKTDLLAALGSRTGAWGMFV